MHLQKQWRLCKRGSTVSFCSADNKAALGILFGLQNDHSSVQEVNSAASDHSCFWALYT